jgi:hypothetical protein
MTLLMRKASEDIEHLIETLLEARHALLEVLEPRVGSLDQTAIVGRIS